MPALSIWWFDKVGIGDSVTAGSKMHRMAK